MKVLKSMKSSHFGYDAETLGAAVQLLMLSGQMAVPQKLFEVAVPKKSAKLLKNPYRFRNCGISKTTSPITLTVWHSKELLPGVLA